MTNLQTILTQAEREDATIEQKRYAFTIRRALSLFTQNEVERAVEEAEREGKKIDLAESDDEQIIGEPYRLVIVPVSMKEELTAAMHGEFTVSKETARKHSAFAALNGILWGSTIAEQVSWGSSNEADIRKYHAEYEELSGKKVVLK